MRSGLSKTVRGSQCYTCHVIPVDQSEGCILDTFSIKVTLATPDDLNCVLRFRSDPGLW